MEIRFATTDDVAELARVHVQAWRETYPGILPEAEIAMRDEAYRQKQWTSQLKAGGTRIAVAPGYGFAQMGPQRAKDLATAYPDELYALYVLDVAKGTGLGLRLLKTVCESHVFTALALEGNERALAFYRKTGANQIGRIPEAGFPDDIVLGWPSGIRDVSHKRS